MKTKMIYVKIILAINLCLCFVAINSTKIYAGEPSAFNGILRDGIGNVYIYINYGKGTVANPGADTMYYRKDGSYYYLSELNSNNWYYNIIRLNDTYIRQDSYSNESAQGTIAHEIGHCFGFGENNGDDRSILSQDWARSKIPGSNQIYYTVGQMDHNVLNRKY